LDKKHMAEGIVTMEMSYTGSQQEARDAAEAALKNEQDARAATPQLSTIRDHTGSGVGNDPDENARRARVGRPPALWILCALQLIAMFIHSVP
jgi:hypothetical protein